MTVNALRSLLVDIEGGQGPARARGMGQNCRSRSARVKSVIRVPRRQQEITAAFVVIERLIIPILTNASGLETLAVFGVT
jgi:hypothetical protein